MAAFVIGLVALMVAVVPARARDRDLDDPVKRMHAKRLQRAEPTSLGVYGELVQTTTPAHDVHDWSSEVDAPHFAVLLAHRFTEDISFYGGIEVEHAQAIADGDGRVGLEQAVLDYRIWDALGLRAGVGQIPMGIVNQWHEPHSYLSAQRPMVETVIIPSTWRAALIGVFGRPAEWLRYQLYVASGIDPLGLSADTGLRGGAQEASLANARGPTVTGRIELQPLAGLVVGASGYYGLADPNIGPELHQGSPSGPKTDMLIPIGGLSVDGRWWWRGIEARAVFAWFSVGDTAELRDAYDATGTIVGPDLGSSLLGGYGELGIDILTLAATKQQFLPNFRVERYDTMASVEGRPETAADVAHGVTDLAAGLTWRPVEGTALKADVTLRNPDGSVEPYVVLHGGGGVAF